MVDGVVAVVLAVLSISAVVCFNFETRLPIVKYGASNRSGSLFKCPITQLSNDCEQLKTDGRRTDDEEEDELLPPTSDELKTNQWLGVTVNSGGKENKIFVCAHRYMKVQSKGQSKESGLHLGQGLCYVLNNDFTFGFAVEVCLGRSTKLNEELYESEQSWNGNYLFTWIPKSSVKTGGWQIYGSGTEGYFYIKNEHFGHCLYMKGYGNWIYAYDECQGPKYEWKIYNVDTCKN